MKLFSKAKAKGRGEKHVESSLVHFLSLRGRRGRGKKRDVGEKEENRRGKETIMVASTQDTDRDRERDKEESKDTGA